MNPRKFRESVWRYYRQYGRDLPWRHAEPDGSFDAYKIMVSEVMLQQTQVNRVREKYRQFLTAFPTVQQLAAARLADVLVLWSGLGYNRRAKFLWQAARQLAPLSRPWNYRDLLACPGIGPNTAAAIVVYTYNQPMVFVETNIRTVYIHHFFAEEGGVIDQAIRQMLERTYDRQHPREFYWALMDYGSHLKTTVGNLSRQSRHYTKQSTFQGSRRQVRGAVLRLLAEGPLTLEALARRIPDERLEAVASDLMAEGFLSRQGNLLCLGGT